jgi:hypothetical protein
MPSPPASGNHQMAAAQDVHPLDAALVEHNLALRKFVSEWIDSQEQLLSLGTRRVIDACAASSTHASSNADVSAADGSNFCRKPMQTKPRSLWSQKLSPVVANHETHEVAEEPMDMSEEQQEEQQLESHNGDGASTSATQHRSSRTRPKLQHSSSRIIDATENRFDCPLIRRIESSSIFNTVCGLVIVLNAVTMAAAADYDMRHFQQPGNQVLKIVEVVFVAIYTVEIATRIVARKLAFFQVAWSWFDIIIVSVGWIEVASAYLPSFTQLRLLRILKMVKVMRVLRVMRSFREVRLLLNSLMGSVKPMFWTMLIITGMNFMFGIYFVQSLATFRHDSWKTGGRIDAEQLGVLVGPWNSVMQAMYTLSKVSTGGLSWGDVSDPLLEMGWQTFAIFVFYMTLFMFVIFNAVTSVFVASTEEYAAKDSHSMLHEQLSNKDQYVMQVFSLYGDILGDSTSGEVTKSQFLNHIHDPRMSDFAKSLEIDTLDLEQFFDVLSLKGKRGVDLDTFVDGCIRLRGTAKSMDVYDLLIHQQSLAKEVDSIRYLLEQRVPKGQIL